jgi:hypothetical protein
MSHEHERGPWQGVFLAPHPLGSLHGRMLLDSQARGETAPRAVMAVSGIRERHRPVLLPGYKMFSHTHFRVVQLRALSWFSWPRSWVVSGVFDLSLGIPTKDSDSVLLSISRREKSSDSQHVRHEYTLHIGPVLRPTANAQLLESLCSKAPK